MKKQIDHQSGFTLIELAIVMTIMGIMLATIIAATGPVVDNMRLNATKEKMEKIDSALSSFAQTYGRLPCPADPAAASEPYGAPRGSGTNGYNFATTTCGATVALHVGIVPFRALGLNEEDVTDAFGSLFTYSVSPASTLFNPTAPSGNIYEPCRLPSWINAPFVNLKKNYFCCAGQSGLGDLKVLMASGGSDHYFPEQGHAVAGSSRFQPPSTPMVGTPNPLIHDFGSRFIAYVLVSHGMNKDGAFVRMSSIKRPTTVTSGTQEAENRNDDLNFVWRKMSTKNTADYFDDIVVWRLNYQVFTTLGNDSCGVP